MLLLHKEPAANMNVKEPAANMNVNGARLNHRFDFMNNKSHLLMYNCEMKKARRQYFSQIISDSSNHSKVLFNPIDRLINPPRFIPYELHTEEKCNQFAVNVNYQEQYNIIFH